MLAFSIINFLSFFITFDGSIFPFVMTYMIPVHYLAFGLPRIDQNTNQRRQEIEIIIVIFSILVIAFDIAVVLEQALTDGYKDILFGNARLSGISYSASALSEIAATAALFNIFTFIRYKKIMIRLGSSFSFILQVIILYLTKTRGSMLFLITGALILTLILLHASLSRKKYWLLFSLFGILAIVLCFIVVFSRGVDTSLNPYDFFNKLSTSRVKLWVSGIKAGLDSPLFGNSYTTLLDAYSPSKMAHNLYIDLFARYGIFSLVAFLIFAIALIIKSMKIICANSLASQDYLLFAFSFSYVVALLLQHFIDIYIFFTGYSTANIFFVIFCGFLSYHISKTHEMKGSSKKVE